MGAGQAHGFARNTAFSVIRQTKEKVVLLLAASEATKETFPYDFELEVVVAVSDDNGGTLSQSVRCTSLSMFSSLTISTLVCVGCCALRGHHLVKHITHHTPTVPAICLQCTSTIVHTPARL